MYALAAKDWPSYGDLNSLRSFLVRRKLALMFAALVLLTPLPILANSSSHSSHKSSDNAGKTEHVSGYHRKDGTYVAPYDRHPAGTAPHPGDVSTSQYAPVPYQKGYLTPGYTADALVTRDSHGKIKRSGAAKDAFKRENPCPATGKSTGSCPGYVIDHVNPLECGGADAPSNMQWQTVADGKAKDKAERYCR
jgi:hypothetical protein